MIRVVHKVSVTQRNPLIYPREKSSHVPLLKYHPPFLFQLAQEHFHYENAYFHAKRVSSVFIR